MTRKTTTKTKATKTTKAPAAAKAVAAPAQPVQTAAPVTAAVAAPTTPILSAMTSEASINVKPVVSAEKTIAQRAVSTQDVALRAYEIFRARGGRPGNPLHDWLQAERELARA